MSPHPRASHSFLAVLARLYWMLFGNFALVLSAGGLLHADLWSWRDAAFFAILASIVLVRALDTFRLGGRTADGVPSTASHVRRHALVLGAVALVTWVAAKGIARWGGVAI